MTENAILLPTLAPDGMRYRNLRKSFRFALMSLLQACSEKDVQAISSSSSFSEAEKKAFQRFLAQVIRPLHKTLHVGTILNTGEQLVDDQSLGRLSGESKIFDDMKEKNSKSEEG